MIKPHLWLRAEQRDNETRVGLTPEGAATLMAQGFRVTVEASDTRIIPTDTYAKAGCTIAAQNSWPDAPADAIIFGLKELPSDGRPLTHRHIMFGHAFKGQSAGRALLERFTAGKGTLYDLEYLTDETGRRVAAFGYWAGFAGAAVAVKCWIAQMHGTTAAPITPYANADALTSDLKSDLGSLGADMPDALIIGALGRVGTGAADLCKRLNIPVTGWDMAETLHGGPFPEILNHALFLNCILAGPKTPVFIPADTAQKTRALRVIGDIACDPDSDFNPVQVYDRTTTWEEPGLRVHDDPPLEVTAIDNLPSMLPLESSEDYATKLLPTLSTLADTDAPVWARANATFDLHIKALW
jgi:saccharopine dehydrogenase (NAD+, L-lysine-forming)